MSTSYSPYLLPKQQYFQQKVQWEPQGWWTPLGLPDFKFRAFIQHKGDYTRWRLKYYTNKVFSIVLDTNKGPSLNKKGKVAIRPRNDSQMYESQVEYYTEKLKKKCKK